MRFSLRTTFMRLVAAGCFGTLILGTDSTMTAKALMVAPPMPGQQATMADCVVVGKVVEIEKDLVQATQFPGVGNPKVGYRIASIKIEDPILGAKGLTHIRVGFVPPAAPVAAPVDEINGGNVKIIRRPAIGRVPVVSLTEGMEACFLLKAHHEGDFFVAVQPWAPPIDKKSEAFKDQLAEIKKVLKVFENPIASLQAKELNDRYIAAQTLLQKYRTNNTGTNKTEPISAEESKLILKVLSEVEWFNPKGGVMHRQNLWYMLGIPQTAFKNPQPQPGQDFNKLMNEATSAWLKENANTYRIERFVSVKK